AVTAVSNWLAGEAGAVLPNLKPVVAPMPVDTTLFAPGSERSTDRLLFVGRVNAQKGVSTLIDALPAIQQPYTVDIIGDGPDRTSLEAHARELHVADRIRWHGALPHDALPPIDEGLGLVAVEGQICATPVIAANSGGLGDIVRNGQTGVLVPPLDAPALASAIDDILANPDRAHELGAAGRVHALASFAPESAARRYAMLYRSTLEHAKKS